jgi:hypothetical protein
VTPVPNCLRQKSDKNWEEGNHCLKSGMIDAAASRLYYAVFEAVYGFGIHNKDATIDSPVGTEKSKHALAIAIVKTHRSSHTRYFITLKGLRIRADYRPESVNREQITDELMTKIANIREYFINITGSEL